VEFVQKKIS